MRIQFGDSRPSGPSEVRGSVRRLALVLDDDPTVRLMMRILLEVGAGVQVLEAQTSEQAWDAASKFRLSLMLCNLVRPRIVDGLQFVGSFRQEYPGIPVVVVSSALDPVIRSRAFELGAYACVGKVIAASNLVDTVQRALSSERGYARQERVVRREAAWRRKISRCLEGRWPGLKGICSWTGLRNPARRHRRRSRH